VTPAPPDERLLKLYSDVSFLPPGKGHVAMLYPFLGTGGKGWSDSSAGVFDEYLATGSQFFRMTTLADADVAILPGAWSHYIDAAEGRALAKDFVAIAKSAGKRTIVFFNSDSTEEVQLDDSLIFRTSLNRSRKRPNEFALPAWSEDIVERRLDGKLPIRPKSGRPVVGFCGFAAPLIRSWVRNFARWGASVAGMRHGATNPLLKPGHAVRLKAMRALENSPAVDTNFVVRGAFFGSAEMTQSKYTRGEYVQNMIDSDYTLCVRGAGNFSYRLYETLSCGRIPVFVDTDCVLPYDSVIRWKDYCVYLDESEVARIGDRVAEFHAKLSPSGFEELQRECRKLWKNYISPEGFFRNFHRHLG
jgi:hypothetical protein